MELDKQQKRLLIAIGMILISNVLSYVLLQIFTHDAPVLLLPFDIDVVYLSILILVNLIVFVILLLIFGKGGFK